MLFHLDAGMEISGPVRGNWPKFSFKLSQWTPPLSFEKRKTTYVAVWEVTNRENKINQVIYAGTHEKHPTEAIEIRFIGPITNRARAIENLKDLDL